MITLLKIQNSSNDVKITEISHNK